MNAGEPRPGLPSRYATALGAWLDQPGEEARAEAYELGRAAISEGFGVLDVAQAHCRATSALGAGAHESAGRFLAEVLAPYEMALRGFRDANSALRDLNGSLEARIAHRTRELVRTEASLRDQTRVLEGVLDSMTDGVAVSDASGAWIRLNGAGRELLGGGGVAWFASDEKTPIAEADRPLARALAGREVRDEELFVRSDTCPNGAHVSVSAAPLATSAGGAVLVLRDIGQRRRAEENTRKVEERLRQSQKMDAIGQLAGGVAHDFNNLLAVIISYAELAQLDLPAGHSAREDLGQIEKAADSAAALTRQLLAFSRRQVIQPTVIDLNTAIRDVERMLRRTIGEHIELATHLAPDLGPVVADRGQIEQVVMNLAVNARDAMPNGGRLMIETANAELGPSVTLAPDVAPGAYSVLAVTDTGIGMDEATRARIFEPFFTTKEPGKGTGLGLATVYGIVRQSQGTVWVYSEPGRGTTFKLYFPHAQAPETAPEPKPVRRDASGHETILLVEDADALRLVAVRVLSDCGYRVLPAAHPTEARALAVGHPGPIHLLLTDVVMPGSSGPELAADLARSHPEMRVLFTSGYASAGVAHGGALPPRVEFLEKPFSPEQLRTRVRALLDGRKVS